MPDTYPPLLRYKGTDPQTNAYQNYSQKHAYSYDPGLIYLPVASAEPTMPVRVRLHGGFGMRTIDWTAVRHNAPPVLPGLRLDKDEDYDSQADIDAAGEDDPDLDVNTLNVRPGDRVVQSTTVLHLPIPDPSAGGYSFAATGQIVMCQVLPEGPRVLGQDALPTGGRPFDMGILDQAAADQFASYTPGSDQDIRQSEAVCTFLESNENVLARVTGWPCTIYPAYFTNNSLIQE